MPEEMVNATAELARGNRPVAYVGRTLDDFKLKPQNEAALEVVTNYHDNLGTLMGEGRGLCITGPPQEGKTLLATIVLNVFYEFHTEMTKAEQHVAARHYGAGNRPGFPIYFITLSQYVRAHLRKFDLRAAWEKRPDADAEYEEYKEWDTFLTALRDRVELLVIDDVGKEHKTGSGFAEDEFDYLLRQRQHHQLPTIFTSNLAVEEWSESYHESVTPFVRRTCDIAAILDPDTKRPSARRNNQRRVPRKA